MSRRRVAGRDAAAPPQVIAPCIKITRKLAPADADRAIVTAKPQLLEPKFMNQRRFAVVDRIADNFGIGNAHQPLPRAAVMTRARPFPSDRRAAAARAGRGW